LQKQIEDFKDKRNGLDKKIGELEQELESTQNSEVVAIVNSIYKTPGEISEFIKQAKSGDFVLQLLRQQSQERTYQNQYGMEEQNDFEP